MSGREAGAEYRIEDLAHASGATVRTIRAYQDRGLLPTPERRGR
ncbi:MerR family DNA-binding transcriptional regulator, partial [Streptomyces sp. SID8455]|nr:MerR family DNA-binding transcriptional regulator [Streptomyces sp. SID8455]